MLRPLYLDLLDVFIPLFAVVAALLAGRQLHRLPSAAFRAVIGLSVFVVLLLGASYFVPFPEPINDFLWHLGGETTVATVLATLLLGVVWSARGRSTSTGFLRAVVGLIALIVVLHSGGRLWWRTFGQATWQNTPNSDGCLTQMTGWTCSPAVAAMLLHHYGIETSEGEMAYLANTSYLGTDARSIARALSLKGQPQHLAAHFLRADYETGQKLTAPFLACVNIPGLGGHAVLVLGMSPDDVSLIDPRFGRRQKIARQEIEPQWEGKIVHMELEK